MTISARLGGQTIGAAGDRAWAFTLIGLISVVVMAAGTFSAAISNAYRRPQHRRLADCGADGLPWAETAQLYAAGPQLNIAGPVRLGGIDLSDLTHSRELVTDLSISEGVAHVTWMANGPNDRECRPTVKMTGDLRWDGSTVVAQNVHRVN
jgi:hypothetical protein